MSKRLERQGNVRRRQGARWGIVGVLLAAFAVGGAAEAASRNKTVVSPPPKSREHVELRTDKEPTAPGHPAGLRKVRTGPHVEVHARDMRLGDTARERLERIAERYFKATRRKLVLTGGTRTPERQAELMYEKLKHSEDIVALYENKAAATEIRNAYRAGVSQAFREKALIRAIRDTVLAQIAKGTFVSRHLQSGAADVRSRDMKPSQEQALRAAVKEEPGVTLLDERSSAEPHLHLSL